MPSILKFSIALGLLSISILAEAQTVRVLRDGQPLPLSGKPKWAFLSVSPGVKSYFARVIVKVPAGKAVKEIRGPSLLVKPKWIKASRVALALGRMSTPIEVEYSDGSRETWTADVRLAKSVVALKGCREAGLKVEQAKGPSAPVFFAAECSVKEDRIIFNPSVPGDMEWDVTSIFETDGKGERWKIFEIARNNLVAGGDVVATLGFQWKGARTSFTVLQDRGKLGSASEAKKELGNRTKARMDFGGSQFESKSPALSGSAFGPYLGGELISKELFWKLRGLASGRYVFPLSGGSSYEFSGGLGKTFGQFLPGTSTLGVFGEYVALGQSVEADQRTVTFQHNQFGVAALWAKTMAKSELKVIARYSGLGGDSTALGFELAYEGIFAGKQAWGAVARYGSQSASAPAGSSTFGQMSVGATLTF